MKTMQLTQKQKTLIGMGIAIAIALLIFILWYMITHPVFTAAVTDIWIIILALVVLVMNVFLIIMLWQIIRLIDFLLFELKPVLESLQETSSTVRGTATFVSDEVSSPIIDASAKTARCQGLAALRRGQPDEGRAARVGHRGLRTKAQRRKERLRPRGAPPARPQMAGRPRTPQTSRQHRSYPL